MTTLSEILDAARQLPRKQQWELIEQLGNGLERAEDFSRDPTSIPGLPPNFNQRLQELFHRAKRKALEASADR